MAKARTPSPAQPSLLDWEPPVATARFADDQVRAATLADKICKGIAVALKEAAQDRDEIAARMSEFLGKKVSRSMLDAYSSQAREDHMISVVRFIALVHATQDRRLLEMVAEIFGWTVIERRFLKLIELASIQEREDALRRQREALRRQAKSEGML